MLSRNNINKQSLKKLFLLLWCSFFFCILLTKQSFAQDSLINQIPADTVFLDGNDFLVKKTCAIYQKPQFLQNKVLCKDVFYKGQTFWFRERYDYYRNGQLKWVDFLIYAEKEDTFLPVYYKHYFRNGLLESEGQLAENPFFEPHLINYYKNGKIKENIGVKDSMYHGVYQMYYPNGRLKTERIYEKGKLMEIVSYFDQTGFPLDPGTLEEGYGEVKIYSSKGKLVKKYKYQNGLFLKQIPKKNQ